MKFEFVRWYTDDKPPQFDKVNHAIQWLKKEWIRKPGTMSIRAADGLHFYMFVPGSPEMDRYTLLETGLFILDSKLSTRADPFSPAVTRW